MVTSLLLSLSAGAQPLEAVAAWSEPLDWGGPLPQGLAPEADWPWAAGEGARCGWQGALLLCDDGGGLSRAYRAWEGPVEGAAAWIRCAGLEWCAGALVLERSGGRALGRWASRLPPHRGWEWSLPADPVAEPVAEPVENPAVPVAIAGGEVWGPQALSGLAGRLGACQGTRGLERFPLQVIYDEQGARKVRLQGSPPEGLAALCVVLALAETPRPADGRSVEIMVTGGSDR